MTTRPNQQTRQAGREQIAALKAARDQIHQDAEKAKAEADKVMWQAIGQLIQDGHAIQSDAAAATGFSRDHVAKRIALYRKQ
ncbi:hypothetical protein KV557_24700 [Kitasatospora aureofaciens]|uniref:hypothetical protein n=1 Tax=Kitasatospora aureofaciens TaxID=1894 RepID=UPI001C491BAD|nr:hypothetical protein [Kitasatospora aureofaciens]MBV6700265.1 hypothetical protein [Kitasatospora aureofaciens]